MSQNFGHAIFEALAVGLPCVISDKTPFNQLAEANAGYVCKVDEIEAYAEKIDCLLKLNQADYLQKTISAKKSSQKFKAAPPPEQKSAAYLKRPGDFLRNFPLLLRLDFDFCPSPKMPWSRSGLAVSIARIAFWMAAPTFFEVWRTSFQ